MMETIAEMWASYRTMVIPKGAPTVQIRECRLSFYAGVSAMLAATFALADPAVDEDAGVNYLASLQREMIQFKNDVEAGKV